MIEILNFIKGAISSKDFIPVLKHFHIKNGVIQGHNGYLTLNSSIPLNIDCSPNGDKFIKAISGCTTAARLTFNEKLNKLKIASGSFTANIECTIEKFDFIIPDEKQIEIDGEALLKALKTLKPFISSDASRLWSNGILFKDNSAFATNNLILIEYFIGSDFKQSFNLPSFATNELIRINEIPTHMGWSDGTVTFYYDNDKWLKTSLYSTEWPDISKIFPNHYRIDEIDPELFVGLDNIKQFLNVTKSVYFKKNNISTNVNDHDGARYDLPISFEAIYNHDMLMLLKSVCTHIDLSRYPKPGYFNGENTRGIIIGIMES